MRINSRETAVKCGTHNFRSYGKFILFRYANGSWGSCGDSSEMHREMQKSGTCFNHVVKHFEKITFGPNETLQWMEARDRFWANMSPQEMQRGYGVG